MRKLDTLLQKSEEKKGKKSAEKRSKIPRKNIKKLDRNYFIHVHTLEAYLGRFIEWPKSSMVWDSKEKNNMLFSLLSP
jgi:hypothetical protein